MTKDLEVLLEAFPPESRELIRDLWSAVPSDVRRELELTLGGVVKLMRRNPGSATDLVRIMHRMAAPALTPMTRVAIVGPVNVGKSTLYNRLVLDKNELAEVSPVPGTTKKNQTTDLGLFSLVDTPGADHGSEEKGSGEREEAFGAASEADFLLILFDAARSVTASDRALYDELRQLRKPYLVVLNKIDLVTKAARPRVVEAAASNLGLRPDQIISISADRSSGVERIILEMAATEPRLLGELGSMMKPLRRKLAWQCIRRSVMGAALIALTPIPLMDVIPITAIQVSMVLTLARIHGLDMGWARARELITTFGAAWLARTVFQELSKVAGAPGWVLSSSIAASATLAIGFATLRWFESGNKPSREELRELTRKSQSKLAASLARLGRKKPSKQSLTEELDRALPSLTDELDEQLEPTTTSESDETPFEEAKPEGEPSEKKS